MADLRVETLTGPAAKAHVRELSRLRIAVFREFPYLYDGDEASEAAYLASYTDAHRAAVVVARDEERIVGAATALPLSEAQPEVRKPFEDAGSDLDDVFYFGESVLLPAYRGRGIGVRFFEHREAHARSFGGFRQATFCAVERAPDHPRRPAAYVPLDAFWRNRGYRPDPRHVCHLAWKEVGEAGETEKRMLFWVKDL